MNHYLIYVLLPCHIIDGLQKDQAGASLISLMSDRITGCHAFNGTVTFQPFMQFSQPSIHQHQDHRRITGTFVFFHNLTVRDSFRIFLRLSLYCNMIHFLFHKSCLHFCYADNMVRTRITKLCTGSLLLHWKSSAWEKPVPVLSSSHP